MTSFERSHLDALLRSDLSAFVQRSVQTVAPGTDYQHNWHIDAMAHHLSQCLEGRIRRLIVTLPPRNLKSICGSVAFPAFALGRDPTRRIICASYGNELTAKLARDCRGVMETEWYQRIFPATRINPKKSAELDFETTRQGYRFGTSVGGALTGRGGSLIIIDDPIKPGDAMSEPRRNTVKEWYDSTLFSRLDDKRNDVIVILMQRVHVDDLVGHVLEKGGGWVHLDLPAIAEEEQAIEIGPGETYRRRIGDVLHPEREPRRVLDEIRRQMGTATFNAQYQQRPVPLEGNLVKWDWFRTYHHLPAIGPDGRFVQSWDTASKAGELNDYSVCTTWLMKGDEFYLLDVLRERLDYPALKKRVVEMAKTRSVHTILIEDKGSGIQLAQEIRRSQTGASIIRIEPEADKVTRMSNQSAKIEGGQVYLPRDAPWMADFKAEMLAFPNARHDDQVDSVSQFLGWIDWRRRRMSYSSRSVGLV